MSENGWVWAAAGAETASAEAASATAATTASAGAARRVLTLRPANPPRGRGVGGKRLLMGYGSSRAVAVRALLGALPYIAAPVIIAPASVRRK